VNNHSPLQIYPSSVLPVSRLPWKRSSALRAMNHTPAIITLIHQGGCQSPPTQPQPLQRFFILLLSFFAMKGRKNRFKSSFSLKILRDMQNFQGILHP